MATVQMDHPLLEFKSDTVESIRKMFNLDNEDRLNETIELFESWVKKQTHFKKQDFDRAYLEKLLITCKGSVEKSKLHLDKLCTIKTLVPKFFIEVNVKEHFDRLFSLVSAVMLPKITADHQRIFLARATGKPFVASDVLNFFQYCIYICEYVRLHDYVSGFVIIYDFRKISITDLLTKINLVEFQYFVRILIECYGARLKAIHIMNDSKGIELFLKTLKQFLSKKIADRIFVHSTNEDIHKVVPREFLPAEYDGKVKSVVELQNDWAEELSTPKFREYIKVMNTAGTNEEYRLKCDFDNQYMGMPGTFRTMTLD